MTEQDVVVGNLYKNLKTGSMYRVTGFSRDSESLACLVRYVVVVSSPPADVVDWARPMSLFISKFCPAK